VIHTLLNKHSFISLKLFLKDILGDKTITKNEEYH